jgi:uncharacterized membrane protein (DUF485 family)
MRHTDVAPTQSEARLRQLLRQQRILAWILSIFTFAMTTGFFALMGFGAPILSRVAFGRSITNANVVAVTIILLILASIAFFEHRAVRIDALLHNEARESR